MRKEARNAKRCKEEQIQRNEQKQWQNQKVKNNETHHRETKTARNGNLLVKVYSFTLFYLQYHYLHSGLICFFLVSSKLSICSALAIPVCFFFPIILFLCGLLSLPPSLQEVRLHLDGSPWECFSKLLLNQAFVYELCSL